jgi:hypothetical protein
MLLLGQAALRCLVINSDHDFTLLAAMINRDTGPAVLKALLYLTFSELTDKLLTSVLVVRIIKQLPDIQYPGMVIKSHIQTGDMEAVILGDHPEKTDKVSAAVFLESPASLAGHIQADSHIRIAIIQNRNASEINAVPVAVPALFHGGPCQILHMKERHPIPGVLLLAGYRQPIKQDHVFGNRAFHNFLPLSCR